MGRIFKVKIDLNNKAVHSKSKLMQWTDTDQVISWLIGLDKETYSYSNFDVIDFYPSVNEKLVTKSLKIAKSYNIIPTDDLVLIKKCL